MEITATTKSEVSCNTPEHGASSNHEDTEAQLNRLARYVSIDMLDDAQINQVLDRLGQDLDDVLEGRVEKLRSGIMRKIWDDMAVIVHNIHWSERSVFSREQMEAQKLYTAGLLDAIIQKELEGTISGEDNSKIYTAYLASSDTPLDYVGGYDDKLELFSLSQRSKTARSLFAGSLQASMVYDGSFGDIGPSLESIWQKRKAADSQISYITSLDVLLRAAENEMYPTERMQKNILSQLRAIGGSEEAPVFVRRIAEHYFNEASTRSSQEWVYLDELPADERQRLIDRHNLDIVQREREQQALHEAFPALSADSYLYRVSIDACAEIYAGRLDDMRTLTGETVNLQIPYSKNTLGISIADAELLQQAHQADVLSTVELETGIDLRTLALEAQLKFFRFMAQATADRYERLCTIVRSQPDEKKIKLAEAFLATGFGDELGDAILDLAEADDTGETLDETLSSIQSIRASVAKIADSQTYLLSQRAEFEQIPKGMKRAVEQRVSEILSPLADLIAGNTQIVSFAIGEKEDSLDRVETFEEVLQSLKLLDVAMKKIADSESESMWGDNTLFDEPANRHESEKSQVAVTMRSRQSKFGEARIAWTVQFTPDEQAQLLGGPVAFSAKGEPKSTPVSIRLDLEEHSHALSLDIGGVNLAGRPLDQRIATAVSLGAQHLASRKGEHSADADYHVRNTFVDIHNPAELFADFVDAKRHDVEIMRNKRVGKNALKVTTRE